MAISKDQPLRPYVQALGDAVDSNSIITSKAVHSFDTIAEMQAATYLTAGMTCHTNGFNAADDGGAAWYAIGTSGAIACAGGLYATEINAGSEHLGIMVLGDSYGEGYTPDGNVTSWTSYFSAKAQQYGYTVYSSALGGAGFWRDDTTKRFSTLAGNLLANLTYVQRDSIGAVVVGGGYNDRSNTRANIYSGMVELRDIINNNLPNVRRVLIFPFGMGVQGMTTGEHAGFQYSTIVDMIRNYVDANVEAKLGTVVGGSNMILRKNNLFSSDYVHPNQNGNYIIGAFVSDVFFGNPESLAASRYNYAYTPNLVASSGVSLADVVPEVYPNDSAMELRHSKLSTVTPTTPFDLICDGEHPYTICTTRDAAIQQYGRIVIPITATVRSSTSAPLRYQQLEGLLLFENGYVRLNFVATSADGTSFLTVSAVDRIMYRWLVQPTIDGLTLIG